MRGPGPGTDNTIIEIDDDVDGENTCVEHLRNCVAATTISYHACVFRVVVVVPNTNTIKPHQTPLTGHHHFLHLLWYHTIPYHTIPYHTIPYHTIPYHTIPVVVLTVKRNIERVMVAANMNKTEKTTTNNHNLNQNHNEAAADVASLS
eukprot:scaffold1200_cov136-Amphora_coffeaeformis.AAC.2